MIERIYFRLMILYYHFKLCNAGRTRRKLIAKISVLTAQRDALITEESGLCHREGLSRP